MDFHSYIQELSRSRMLKQPLTKIVNNILSNLILQEFYKDYKRTQQGVSNVLLSYLY